MINWQHGRLRSRVLHRHTARAFPPRIWFATFWHVVLLLACLPAGLSSRDVFSANQADLAQLPLSSHTCNVGNVVQDNYCTFSNLVLWQNQLFYVASGTCATCACLKSGRCLCHVTMPSAFMQTLTVSICQTCC